MGTHYIQVKALLPRPTSGGYGHTLHTSQGITCAVPCCFSFSSEGLCHKFYQASKYSGYLKSIKVHESAELSLKYDMCHDFKSIFLPAAKPVGLQVVTFIMQDQLLGISSLCCF